MIRNSGLRCLESEEKFQKDNVSCWDIMNPNNSFNCTSGIIIESSPLLLLLRDEYSLRTGRTSCAFHATKATEPTTKSEATFFYRV